MAFVGLLTHGMGCKMCPPGKYVSPESAPGKSENDCKGCPQGQKQDYKHTFCTTCYGVTTTISMSRVMLLLS